MVCAYRDCFPVLRCASKAYTSYTLVSLLAQLVNLQAQPQQLCSLVWTELLLQRLLVHHHVARSLVVHRKKEGRVSAEAPGGAHLLDLLMQVGQVHSQTAAHAPE